MTEKTNGLDGFEELSGSDQISAERLRRMKAMMRQIHREEFEARKFRMRPIKGKFLILMVSFASIILFGVTALYNFNLLVTLEEKVLSSQGHLEYTLQRRANLAGNLVNLALNQAALEREVFRAVNEGRVAMSGQAGATVPEAAPGASPPLDAAAVETAGEVKGGGGTTGLQALAAKASWDRLLALVEQYPDIKISGSYQKLMGQLVDLEDRISQRADERNEQVRIYNTMITSYPWYVLAQMTGFNRYDYYNTPIRYEDFPKLDSETYRALLPPVAPPLTLSRKECLPPRAGGVAGCPSPASASKDASSRPALSPTAAPPPAAPEVLAPPPEGGIAKETKAATNEAAPAAAIGMDGAPADAAGRAGDRPPPREARRAEGARGPGAARNGNGRAPP